MLAYYCYYYYRAVFVERAQRAVQDIEFAALANILLTS